MSAAAMKLRDYRSEDLDTIASIEQQCFPSAIAFRRDSLIKMLYADSHAIIAEAPDREIAGFAVYRKVNRVTGSLLTLDVLPQHRRQGLGSQLVAACTERLERIGVEKLQLRVALNNHEAQALYERLGLRRLRIDRAFYRDGSDALVLETLPWARSWAPDAIWTRFREGVRHYRVTGKLRRLPNGDRS